MTSKKLEKCQNLPVGALNNLLHENLENWLAIDDDQCHLKVIRSNIKSNISFHPEKITMAFCRKNNFYL